MVERDPRQGAQIFDTQLDLVSRQRRKGDIERVLGNVNITLQESLDIE